MKKREYKDYQEYIDHQKEKTEDPTKREKWLNEEWEYKINAFKKIFDLDVLKECKTALCVCARMGQEVVALREIGIDAVGIDLVPHPPLVIEGDMHDLKFEDNSFDFVFSNSFDHSLYPEKFISEIERVASKYIYLQLQDNVIQDYYTATQIKDIKEVLDLFKDVHIIKSENIKTNEFGMDAEILVQV